MEDGETVLVEIMGIGDSGADTGMEISEVRQIIGDQRLSDASCLLKGATGTSDDLARNILSIVKENGAIVNIDTRKTWVSMGESMIVMNQGSKKNLG